MKTRKITELEKKLIDKGFKLKSKNYCGKHSQSVMSYVYKGIVEVAFDDNYSRPTPTFITLDSKRTEIISIEIANFFRFEETLNLELVEDYVFILKSVEKFVKE